jgi:hypothetical protein
MIPRGWTTAGALALCALAFCAFAAAGASAIEKGLTAVKCVEVAGGTGNYETSHCDTAKPGTAYDTVAIEGSTEIEGTSTNAEGGAEGSQLTATIGGLNVIVICAIAHGTGSVTNVVAKDEKGVERHAIHGTNIVIKYTECHAVLASKPARTCEVASITGGVEVGRIQTTPLTLTTVGTEHQVKLEPVTTFSQFQILNLGKECFFKNQIEVTVTGSVEGEATTTTHSHLTFTVANNGVSLKVNGGSAHYVGTCGAWMLRTLPEFEPKVTVGAETF